MKIYLVEDDQKLQALLASFLKKHGYDVTSPKDFSDIKNDFLRVSPDLVLMDVNLPYFDGFYWTTLIRQVSDCPIIFISARESTMDQIMALEYGGDDYITKPFSYELVLAKIKRHLRRVHVQYSEPNKERIFSVNGLSYYPEKLMFSYCGHSEYVSQKEGEMLAIFIDKSPNIVDRVELLSALWDDENFVDDNTLSVNITRLRKKLSSVGLVEAIQTIRGRGYKLIVTGDSLHD